MMPGVEHMHTLVDCLLDYVVGVSGNLFWSREQNGINDMNDSIGCFDICFHNLGLVNH